MDKRFKNFDEIFKTGGYELETIEIEVFNKIYTVKTDIDIITAMKLQRKLAAITKTTINEEGKEVDDIDPDDLYDFWIYMANMLFGEEVVQYWFSQETTPDGVITKQPMTKNQFIVVMTWVNDQLIQSQAEAEAKYVLESNPKKAPRKKTNQK